ncbi:hypothetical protein C8R46DRAFT_1221969 [Mycena filopes]|nr:hypothetical protein C8R46DRAFT_1221969 [Mycena filopes]
MAALGGSFSQLAALRQEIKIGKAPPLTILPVVHGLLDPIKIPPPESLDALEQRDPWAQDAVNVISTAMLAWDILVWDILEVADVPADAAMELWPRLWAWFEFMDTYRNCLSGRLTPSKDAERRMLSGVVSFPGRFAMCEQTIHCVKMTPGIYAVVARAWSGALEMAEPREREHELFSILRIVTSISDSELKPETLEQLVEGAGGSFGGLASLVKRHFHRVVGKGDIAVTNMTVHLALESVAFIGSIEEITQEDPVACGFLSELLRQDVIQCILHTVLVIRRSPGKPVPSEEINRCFVLLRHILCHQPTMGAALNKALALGMDVLLRSIIHCGVNGLANGATLDHLDFFLSSFLPSATTHYPTLLAMQRAIDELNSTSSALFQQSFLLESWTAFTQLVNWRHDICIFSQGATARGQQACDNPKCYYVGIHADLKRCSGCRNVYYCSRECQITDWKEGGHRGSCSLQRTLSLGSECGLTLTERSWMRALLHADYSATELEIYSEVVLCLRKFPDAGYLVIFDYTDMLCTTAVYSLATDDWGSHAAIRDNRAEWEDYLTRAARSEGRLTIHAMCCRNGEGKKYWIIPLRARTSTIQDGLKRIAAGTSHSFRKSLEALRATQMPYEYDEDEDFH